MRIEPDLQAIMALQRAATGAKIHDANTLIYLYRLACYAGKTEQAEETKRKMWKMAVDCGSEEA